VTLRPAAMVRAWGAALLLTPLACTPAPPTTPWAGVREITPAFLARTAALDPCLAADGTGRLALAYVVHDSLGADVWLALSADSGAHFGTPVRIDPRRGTVASDARSRPVVLFAPGDRVVLAWSATRDSARAGEDVVARSSDDGGVSFGPEVVLDAGPVAPESAQAAYVALANAAPGRVLACWLETPGAGAGGLARATVRLAASEDGGQTWGASVSVGGAAAVDGRPALCADTAGTVALAYPGARDSARAPRLALSRDGGASFAFDTLLSAEGEPGAGGSSAGVALALARGRGYAAWSAAPATRGAGGRVSTARWRVSDGAMEARHAQSDSLLAPGDPLLAPLGDRVLLGVPARAAEDPARRVFAVRLLGADEGASPWLLLGAGVRSATLAVENRSRACAGWVEQTADGPRLRLARLSLR